MKANRDINEPSRRVPGGAGAAALRETSPRQAARHEKRARQRSAQRGRRAGKAKGPVRDRLAKRTSFSGARLCRLNGVFSLPLRFHHRTLSPPKRLHHIVSNALSLFQTPPHALLRRTQVK